MKKLILGIAVFVAIGILFIVFSSSPRNTQSLGGADFISTYQKTSGAILLDVRTPSEFTSGHISEARNVDFESSSFISEIQKLDTKKPYFVYCRSGNRSGQAIAIMKKEGIKNIYELRDGIASNQNSLSLISGTSTK